MTRYRRKKSKFRHWMSLIRFWNTVFCLSCVYVGFVLSGNASFQFIDWALAFGISGLIFAGGNILNDFIDIETDKLAHPSRPIASGAITRKDALYASIGLLAGGVVLSTLTILTGRTAPGLIGLLSALLIIAYDVYLKRFPLIGNLTIGLLGGSVFIFGGSFAEINIRHIFAGIFALLMHTSREIIKDIADMDAEMPLGIRTLPARIGADKAAKFSTLLLITIVPITLVPYFFEVFSLWYLGAVILFADLPIILFAWLIPQSTTPHRASKISRDFKWIMLGGLFALYIGGITV